MKFDLKEMYKFLLSHTFPGLLLGAVIVFSLNLFAPELNVLQSLQNIWVDRTGNIFALIIITYALSTLLGCILDCLNHFFYEDFPYKLKNIKIFKKMLKKHERRTTNSPGFFKKLSNEFRLNMYTHFIDDDLWYYYEAYANMSIVLVLGIIPILGLFFNPKIGIPNLSGIFKFIFMIIYGAVCFIMIYEANRTYDLAEEEEKLFENDLQ